MNHLGLLYQISLLGYCSMNKEALLQKFLEQGASSLSKLSGEYVVIIENNSECYITTSPYNVCKYYYTVVGNELFHDDTVLGVLKKSKLPWSWNWKALADSTQLDHVLENDTLHQQIHRVPPGTILHFRQGTLKMSSLTWDELHQPLPSDPKLALMAFNNSIKEWMHSDVIVSLSGGFDSRTILSSVLMHGCKPLLVSMGFDESTDVMIAKRIATDLGLPLSVVALSPEDYLKHGLTISALTNGENLSVNWHTYIYPQKAQLDPKWPFFVGANGEFARTYYWNKGILAMVADGLAPSFALRAFWRRKLKLIFKQDELKGLHPEFAQEFKEDYQQARLCRLADLCHNELLSGLDRFYLEQRVRNGLSNGRKMYSAHVSWRAPFLSREWVRAIWYLKRQWKLGVNWHRFAIANNYPRLLDFPEAGKAPEMARKAPPLYWLPSSKKYSVISYANYPGWFRNSAIAEFIIDNASVVSELIDSRTLLSIMEQHRKDGNRTRTLSFVLSMIFWHLNLKEE
jgi:asparagine synthase (glutamine-hydrolysing)